MSESKHTPGPWHVTDGAILCDKVNAYGNFSIALYARGDAKLTDEDHANARLVAAAPALLHALENLADVTSKFRWPDGFDKRSFISAARAAIAKATK